MCILKLEIFVSFRSRVISDTRRQRDDKLSMFFAIAEPNRPVTEWINAFGCATKKK
jgi:hypothetical protein